MWFLWIFGNNIEDSMGRLRFYSLLFVVRIGGGDGPGPDQSQFANPYGRRLGAISGVMGA